MGLSQWCRNAIQASYRAAATGGVDLITALDLARALCEPEGGSGVYEGHVHRAADEELALAFSLCAEVAADSTVTAADLVQALSLTSRSVRDWLLEHPERLAVPRADAGYISMPSSIYAIVSLDQNGTMAMQTQTDPAEAERVRQTLLGEHAARDDRPRVFAGGRSTGRVTQVQVFRLDRPQ